MAFSSPSWVVLASAAAVAVATQAAQGQYNNWEIETGYNLLDAEPGPITTGAGVPVTIVETLDPNSGNTYRFNSALAEFGGKTVTFRTATPTGVSSHATNVARYYFGRRDIVGVTNQRSMAPGVTTIDAYSASAWLDSGYLRTVSQDPPIVSPNHSRVASHAYTSSNVYNQFVRLDYVVEKDDFIQIVAAPPGSGSITGTGAAYNGITVGRFDGNNPLNGTTTGVFAYPEGRHKPDIIATFGTSDSVGMVAGAATMLVELGNDPTLSNGSYVGTRTGDTIRHAQTSEVIKAALMAGASRTVSSAPSSGHPITTYRANVTHQTANGLDSRYGAGRLNIRESYHIIAGGEQDSKQDSSGPTAGHIEAYGYDYDPAFGGEALTNAAATYRFATQAGGGRLTATLAWNVPVTYNGVSFDLSAQPQFRGIALELFDVTGGGMVAVADSSSTIDNTQSLWLDLAGGREYALQVRPLGETAFSQDYALGWRIDGWTAAALPEPVSGGLLLLGLGLPLASRGLSRIKR